MGILFEERCPFCPTDLVREMTEGVALNLQHTPKPDDCL